LRSLYGKKAQNPKRKGGESMHKTITALIDRHTLSFTMASKIAISGALAAA